MLYEVHYWFLANRLILAFVSASAGVNVIFVGVVSSTSLDNSLDVVFTPASTCILGLRLLVIDCITYGLLYW